MKTFITRFISMLALMIGCSSTSAKAEAQNWLLPQAGESWHFYGNPALGYWPGVAVGNGFQLGPILAPSFQSDTWTKTKYEPRGHYFCFSYKGQLSTYGGFQATAGSFGKSFSSLSGGWQFFETWVERPLFQVPDETIGFKISGTGSWVEVKDVYWIALAQ
jgi:hypothetical protein